VVLYTVAVGVANRVLVAQFDTKRVSIPSTSVGRYRYQVLSIAHH